MRLVVIGGSDAGISAGLRAHTAQAIDPAAKQVTVTDPADAMNPTVAALAERGVSLAGVSPEPITPGPAAARPSSERAEPSPHAPRLRQGAG
jgi:hypothetical protein